MRAAPASATPKPNTLSTWPNLKSRLGMSSQCPHGMTRNRSKTNSRNYNKPITRLRQAEAALQRSGAYVGNDEMRLLSQLREFRAMFNRVDPSPKSAVVSYNQLKPTK